MRLSKSYAKKRAKYDRKVQELKVLKNTIMSLGWSESDWNDLLEDRLDIGTTIQWTAMSQSAQVEPEDGVQQVQTETAETSTDANSWVKPSDEVPESKDTEMEDATKELEAEKSEEEPDVNPNSPPESEVETPKEPEAVKGDEGPKANPDSPPESVVDLPVRPRAPANTSAQLQKEREERRKGWSCTNFLLVPHSACFKQEGWNTGCPYRHEVTEGFFRNHMYLEAERTGRVPPRTKTLIDSFEFRKKTERDKDAERLRSQHEKYGGSRR